jgi:hypothetical protein
MTFQRASLPLTATLRLDPPPKACSASKMVRPLDRTSLPNFASPGYCRYPVRGDLRADGSNVQCNLCFDENSFERTRPSAMGRARVIYLRPLSNADCRHQHSAHGDLHLGLTSPRSRLGLPEAAEARPIPRSPGGRVAQKVPHGANGFPCLTSLCLVFASLIWDSQKVKRIR